MWEERCVMHCDRALVVCIRVAQMLSLCGFRAVRMMRAFRVHVACVFVCVHADMPHAVVVACMPYA